MIPQIRGGFKKKVRLIYFNILEIKNGGKIHRSFYFRNVDYSTVKVRQTLVVPSDSSPCVNKTRSPETK